MFCRVLIEELETRQTGQPKEPTLYKEEIDMAVISDRR